MKTVEQFLAEYFQERAATYEAGDRLLAPLHRKYYAPKSEQLSFGKWVAEEILSVSQSEAETVVETSGKCPGAWPRRYHLRPEGDSWRIHLVEYGCFSCKGSGICESCRGTGRCDLCDGKGWKS